MLSVIAAYMHIAYRREHVQEIDAHGINCARSF